MFWLIRPRLQSLEKRKHEFNEFGITNEWTRWCKYLENRSLSQKSARKCTKISTKISNCTENQITTFKMLDLWKFWKLWTAVCISTNTYEIRDLHSKTDRSGRRITDRNGSEVKLDVKFKCPGRSKLDQNWAKFWYPGYKCRNDEPRNPRLSWTEWSMDPCMTYRSPRRSYLRTRPIVTVKTYILKNTFQIL